jgi:hypothetical protein
MKKCKDINCTSQKKVGGSFICEHHNLEILHPHLIIEWHSDNPPMNTIHPRSDNKYLWKCSHSLCECHVWMTSVYMRTVKQTQCPFCANRKLCPHNNLKFIHPELINQWSSKNDPMENFPPKSGKLVWWKCENNPCGCHKEWQSTIMNRVNKETNCPYCAGKITCQHNNLEVLYSNLKLEWHPDNLPMKNFSPFSNQKVKWICSKNPCGCHIW